MANRLKATDKIGYQVPAGDSRLSGLTGNDVGKGPNQNNFTFEAQDLVDFLNNAEGLRTAAYNGISALKSVGKSALIDGAAYSTYSYHEVTAPLAKIVGGAHYIYAASSTDTADDIFVLEPSGGGNGRLHLIHDGTVDVSQAGANPNATGGDITASAARINALCQSALADNIMVTVSHSYSVGSAQIVRTGSIEFRGEGEFVATYSEGGTVLEITPPTSTRTTLSNAVTANWTGFYPGSLALTSSDGSVEQGDFITIFDSEVNDRLIRRNSGGGDDIEAQESFKVVGDNGELDSKIFHDYSQMVAEGAGATASIIRVRGGIDRFDVIRPTVRFVGSATASVNTESAIRLKYLPVFYCDRPTVIGDALSDDFVNIGFSLEFCGSGTVNEIDTRYIDVDTTQYAFSVRTCVDVVVNFPRAEDVRRTIDADHTKKLVLNGGTYFGLGTHYSHGRIIVNDATILPNEDNNILHNAGAGLVLNNCTYHINLSGVGRASLFNLREDYLDMQDALVINGGVIRVHVDSTTSDNPLVDLFDFSIGIDTTFDHGKTLTLPEKITFDPDRIEIMAEPGTSAVKQDVAFWIFRLNDNDLQQDRDISTEMRVGDNIQWPFESGADAFNGSTAKIYCQFTKNDRHLGDFKFYMDRAPVFQCFLVCLSGQETSDGRVSIYLGSEIKGFGQIAMDNGAYKEFSYYNTEGSVISRALPDGSEPAARGDERFGAVGSWVWPERVEDFYRWLNSSGQTYVKAIGTLPANENDGTAVGASGLWRNGARTLVTPTGTSPNLSLALNGPGYYAANTGQASDANAVITNITGTSVGDVVILNGASSGSRSRFAQGGNIFLQSGTPAALFGSTDTLTLINIDGTNLAEISRSG